MAKLNFIPPSKGLNGKSYSLCRDWLEVNFYKELCAYCLLQCPNSLEIEHYEPQAYAPKRKNDPTNLLLSCRRCNLGKKDYHPNYAKRQRAKNVNHGYSVIDIREDNYSELYGIKNDGELYLKSGRQKERAKFNAVHLLRLDLPRLQKLRKKCLDYVIGCENMVDSKNKRHKNVFNTLLVECAERYSFLQAYDIPLSEKLRKKIEKYLKVNKPQYIT